MSYELCLTECFFSGSVIPNLSLGLSLSSPYLAPDRLDAFMQSMLVSRISRRVLAEHHITLSKDMQIMQEGQPTNHDHVGIIQTGLNVKDCIDRCTNYLRSRPFDVDGDVQTGINNAQWPEVTVDGHLDSKFAYIREHLE